MSVKLSDIAKKAGVSISTVSRAINRPEMVKESTRNKVLKVVKEMGYKPKVKEKGLVSRKTTVVKSRIRISDIAKASGVSVSTVYRTLNKPDKVSQSTRLRVLKFINELDYKPRVNINKKIVEYKNFMATKPNDTVHKRWGMYTHDARYKDYTASIVKMIMDDMKINTDQAYYMLYYIVSNDIDYERAKRDMMVDPNFEIYRDKRNKRR